MEQTYPVLTPVTTWPLNNHILPDRPGVYAFFDKNNTILYVGKATSIKSRITSGYTKADQDQSMRGERIIKMLENATKLGYVTLENPHIALALEQHLISTLKPIYNIAGKTQNQPKRIYIADQIRIQASHQTKPVMYGPWPNITTEQALNIISDYTQTANCTTATYNTAQKTNKPCYRGTLQTCWAPCVNTTNTQQAQTDETYQQKMLQAKNMLQGNKTAIQTAINNTTQKMKKAAAEQNYELAALHRDKIQTLKHLNEAYRPYLDMPENGTYIAVETTGTQTAYYIITIQNQAITTTESGLIYVQPETIYPALTENAKGQVYSRTPFTYINEKNKPEKTKNPRTKAKKQILQLAHQLAAAEAKKSWAKLSADPAARAQASYELGKTLNIHPPMTIEAWDVSHLGGTKPVGAAFVLTDGLPDKEKSANYYLAEKDGGDDYTSMKNMTRVRTQKADPPDLLLIDGGPGQLQAVLEELADSQWKNIPVVALAKRLEEIHLPDGEVIILGRKNPGLRLLMSSRDGAHKQSVTSQQKRRKIKRKNTQKPAKQPLKDTNSGKNK